MWVPVVNVVKKYLEFDSKNKMLFCVESYILWWYIWFLVFGGKKQMNLDALELKKEQEILSKIWEEGWGAAPLKAPQRGFLNLASGCCTS